MDSDSPAILPDPDSTDDWLALSAINHYLYCNRRCALIHLDGVFLDNAFTVEGQLRHQEADTPGYTSTPGARIVRALPVFSRNLRLSGRADIVEFRGGIPFPVEYKRGRRKQWDNDDAQLCAQALCLEEMFNVTVPEGAIFHASSRRRRDVSFTPSLRAQTKQVVAAVRDILSRELPPMAILKPQCDGCSLRPVCLPELPPASVDSAYGLLFNVEKDHGS